MNFVKKAVVALATTTFIIAPMQTNAQTSTATLCNQAVINMPTLCPRLPADANGLAIISDEVKKTIEEIEEATYIQHEYKEAFGETLLFVQVKDADGNTPTKVYFTNTKTIFNGKFVNPGATRATAIADLDKMITDKENGGIILADAIAPSWVNPSEFKNGSTSQVRYHTTKTKDGKEVLTVKTGTFGWFVVEKNKPTTNNNTPAVTAPTTTATTTPFYTSNKTPFPVVLKDEKTVDIAATKAILETLPTTALSAEDKAIVEAFKDLSEKEMAERVDIKVIEGETVLFVQSDEKTTKVFHKNADSHLLGKFGNKKAGAQQGTPTDLDLTNTVAPSWATTTETITFYHETKEGYTLLNETGHWFYVGKKKTTSTSSSSSNAGGWSGGWTQGTPATTTSTTEVKGDEQTRETVNLFPNFAKKCSGELKNLTDPRLVSYYDALNIVNRDNLNRDLTRAEFLKLVLNAANVDVSNEAITTNYSDVTAEHTLAKYISYATRNGIVSGQNGKFRPNDIVTRAEAAKIFVNSANITLSTEVTTFADVDTSMSLAKHIQTAYDNCLLHGRKTLDGNPIVQPRVFEPNSPITLAETAKVLYNIAH